MADPTRRFPWRTFAALVAAGTLSGPFVIPDMHGLQAIAPATVPPIVALRTVLIIAPVGLAFGWLYTRRGLEAAILSHFVIVHAVRPILEGRWS